MKGVNKAILLGYVWKDPTIRSTKNGKQDCTSRYGN